MNKKIIHSVHSVHFICYIITTSTGITAYLSWCTFIWNKPEFLPESFLSSLEATLLRILQQRQKKLCRSWRSLDSKKKNQKNNQGTRIRLEVPELDYNKREIGNVVLWFTFFCAWGSGGDRDEPPLLQLNNWFAVTMTAQDVRKFAKVATLPARAFMFTGSIWSSPIGKVRSSLVGYSSL